MLVTWRSVHRHKCMRRGWSAWEESRGTGARGEDIWLGGHKEDGGIKIEDWPLPERCWVGGVGPSLTGESDACGGACI